MLRRFNLLDIVPWVIIWTLVFLSFGSFIISSHVYYPLSLVRVQKDYIQTAHLAFLSFITGNVNSFQIAPLLLLFTLKWKGRLPHLYSQPSFIWQLSGAFEDLLGAISRSPDGSGIALHALCGVGRWRWNWAPKRLKYKQNGSLLW